MRVVALLIVVSALTGVAAVGLVGGLIAYAKVKHIWCFAADLELSGLLAEHAEHIDDAPPASRLGSRFGMSITQTSAPKIVTIVNIEEALLYKRQLWIRNQIVLVKSREKR